MWLAALFRVHVPQPVEWAHVAPVCPDAGVEVEEGLQILLDHGLPVRGEPGPCAGRAAIHVHVDPSAVNTVEPRAVAVSLRTQLLGTVMDCHVYLRTAHDTKSVVHEALHCLGYDHVRRRSHVMNRYYERIDLHDFRGIGKEDSDVLRNARGD